MNRIIVICASLCVIVLACTKKAVPAGGSKKGSESGQAQNTQQVKSADGSENDVAVAPVKGNDGNTGSKDSPGTDPANLPTGPSAPNKPSYEEMGKSVYSSKCNKCHGSKNVKNYTFDQWELILKTMIPNAKLTADEESYVMAYIRANAKK